MWNISSHFVLLHCQVQGKQHLSECLLDDLSLMKEVLLLSLFTLLHTILNIKDSDSFECLMVFYFAGEVPVLNVSYKPQKISPKSTVSFYTYY